MNLKNLFCKTPGRALLVLTASVAIYACGGGNNTAVVGATGTDFVIALSPGEEVPSLDVSGATGDADLNIDTDSGAISGSIVVSGLTGSATMAHVHTGFAGSNGPIIFGFEPNADATVWTVPDGMALDATQLDSLSNGGLYLNVHTEANPAGELRGQLSPEGIRIIRTALSGNQEVPPVDSGGSASGVITVNNSTGAIWAAIATNGLDDATMAHIHLGVSGVNGDVLLGLEQDAENVAAWRSIAGDSLDADGLAALEAGGLYFNVHTPAFPAGAVRGQIGGTSFTVRIDNVSTADTLPLPDSSTIAVPLSPGVYIVHRENISPILEPRSPAGAALEALAEDGNASGFPTEIAGSVVFDTPDGASAPGPVGPGGSYSFSFIAVPGDKLSLATMFVQSNDWFYTTTTDEDDSISLFDDSGLPISGDVSDQLSLWETETELDEIPGVGLNQAPRQSGPNVGTPEVGTVGSLAGRGKSVTLNGPVIQVTVSVN